VKDIPNIRWRVLLLSGMLLRVTLQKRNQKIMVAGKFAGGVVMIQSR
jgi:hypothetical protein